MANTYKALSKVTVGAGGAATISFTNIPQTYTDLKIVYSLRDSRSNDSNSVSATVNSVSAGSSVSIRGSGATVVSFSNATFQAGRCPAATALAGVFGNSEMYIYNYASNLLNKSFSVDMVTENNITQAFQEIIANVLSNSSPITSVSIVADGGNTFDQYSTATLYGVFNADVSTAPSAPTIGTASDGGTGDSASITFTGVSGAASYTMTSSPGSLTATGTTSPIVVSGLTTGTAYTFTCTATNPFGTSAASSASNSVTPVPPSYYVMGGDSGGLARSTDLATWTNITTPQPTYDWYGVAKGAGVWAISGQNGYIYSSPDLSTWTLRLNTANDLYGDMKFGSGSFVATGINKQIYTSTDGLTWTQRTSGFTNNVTIKGTVNSTANSKWIVCGNWDSSGGAQYSYATQSNLATWTKINIWTSGTSANKPDANNNIVLVPMSSGDTVKSSDGVSSWGGISVGFTATGGVAWGNSRWVAVGANGQTSYSTSATSNGGTYTTVTVGSTTFRYVKFVNGNFVIGSTATPTFYSSTDGITWTTRSAMSAGQNGNTVAYG